MKVFYLWSFVIGQSHCQIKAQATRYSALLLKPRLITLFAGGFVWGLIFRDDNPMNHFAYDNCNWVEKFGDPLFHHHVAGTSSFHFDFVPFSQ